MWSDTKASASSASTASQGNSIAGNAARGHAQHQGTATSAATASTIAAHGSPQFRHGIPAARPETAKATTETERQWQWRNGNGTANGNGNGNGNGGNGNGNGNTAMAKPNSSRRCCTQRGDAHLAIEKCAGDGQGETFPAAYSRGGRAGDRAVVRLAWRFPQCADRSQVRLGTAPGQRRNRRDRDRCPSIEKIGIWPWPRRLHAELLRQLQSARASDIVFDVDFSTPSDPASDKDFPRVTSGRAAGRWSCRRSSNPAPAATARRFTSIARCRSSASIRGRRSSMSQSSRTDWSVATRSAKNSAANFFRPWARYWLDNMTKRAASFLIDFGISAASIPTLSYVDVLSGDPATLDPAQGQEGHHRRHRA